MLYIETNNQKYQSKLEQQFIKQNNVYAIPVQKSKCIQQMLYSILSETYGYSQIPEKKIFQERIQNNLACKIVYFVEKNIQQKFSLQQLKEIFQMLKIQEKKMFLYENYILCLNKLINDMQQDNQIQLYSQAEQLENKQLQQMFQAHFNQNAGTENNQQQGGGFDFRLELSDLSINRNNNNKYNLLSITQRSCQDEPSTLTSLKNQISNNRKLATNRVSGCHFDGLNTERSDTSCQLDYQNERNKKYEIYQLQIIEQGSLQSSLQTQLHNSLKIDSKISQTSPIIHHHTSPKSFLYQEQEDIINDYEKKQNEELKKKKSINQQLKESSDKYCKYNQEKYTGNIKNIKMQNKLKRKKKNIAHNIINTIQAKNNKSGNNITEQKLTQVLKTKDNDKDKDKDKDKIKTKTKFKKNVFLPYIKLKQKKQQSQQMENHQLEHELVLVQDIVI